ncbi:putative E3 ubiquitin-protein ligase [Coemansia sp. RSA 988]|nr:putative E3 ubiquitin-protein ligase [Coemansia sp. RSA 988]
MVVSHFFLPLRTLTKKARGNGPTGRKTSSNGSFSNGAWSDEVDDDEENCGPTNATDKNQLGMATVSYPGTVSCFKCTVCNTINDLEMLVRSEKVKEDGQLITRTRTPPPPLTLDRLKAGVQEYKKHPEKHRLLEAMIRESFGNWDVLNFSFPNGNDVSTEDPGITFADVYAAYKIILTLPHPFIRAMMNGTEQILRRPGRPLKKPENTRYLLIILENPLLLQQNFPQESSYHHHIVKSILGSVANLPTRVHYALVLWLSQNSRTAFKSKVQLVNQYISYRVEKYDRAKRRNREQQHNHQQQHALTSYSSQSAQTELPAFQQRMRSNTGAQQLIAQMADSRLGRHNRMRSNTDSRISMSSRKPEPIKEITEKKSDTETAPVERDNENTLDSRSGLGIANLSIRDTPTRFASLGASQIRTQNRMHEHLPMAPGQMHLRSADLPCSGREQNRSAAHPRRDQASDPSISDCDPPISRPEQHHVTNLPPPPPAALVRDIPGNSGIVKDSGPYNTFGARVSHYVPLRSGEEPASSGYVPTSPADASGRDAGFMTGFTPVVSPTASRPTRETIRARAASMSAGDLLTNWALHNEEDGEEEETTSVHKQSDAVRPPRDSVMGVLDGTAEPNSPPSSVSGGRSSLTRARSSSEAPMRRRQRQYQQHGRRADNEVLASAEPPSTQTVGDWGAGVDLDDYYVGADGVFYPKTNSLVMHQHDWRLVTAAKVMALLHAANLLLPSRSRLPLEAFYNSEINNMDIIADYDAWQARVPGAFSFCQYPFLLSLRAKVQIMQVDAARQMNSKLKEAVITALFQNHSSRNRLNDKQHPYLKLLVRRKCLVEDSLHQLATHEQDLKKRLRIEFAGEEGVDAGGLTKEWFMLLLRELMNPIHGMFTSESEADDAWGTAYWFNPASFESSNQYFLVGIVVGLALYNSTILDLHLPLAVFKKLMRTGSYQAFFPGIASVAKSADANPISIVSGNQIGPANGAVAGRSVSGSNKGVPASAISVDGAPITQGVQKKPLYAPCYGPTLGAGSTAEGRSPVYGLLSSSAQLRYQINEMLADVSQFRPQLARGLRQLLQYRANDVEEVFCLSFEASYDAFGEVVTAPLVPNGTNTPVTSQNRVEYVLRYLQWVLNDSVAKQFEPFRRGFYYVCGSNALSLFKPEEIELMVQGSGADWEPKDLQAITEYVNFGNRKKTKQLIEWFWEVLVEMSMSDRRLFLVFVTGSDRMPSPAANSRLKMRLVLLGYEHNRFPIAHTCFNQLGIWMYRSKAELRDTLATAVRESEGFGLK